MSVGSATEVTAWCCVCAGVLQARSEYEGGSGAMLPRRSRRSEPAVKWRLATKTTKRELKPGAWIRLSGRHCHGFGIDRAGLARPDDFDARIGDGDGDASVVGEAGEVCGRASGAAAGSKVQPADVLGLAHSHVDQAQGAELLCACAGAAKWSTGAGAGAAAGGGSKPIWLPCGHVWTA